MSRVLVLTHANLENRKVYFTLPIVAWHFNKPTECTIVYTSFNNGILIKETPEEIQQLVEGATNDETQKPQKSIRANKVRLPNKK
jgi:hypothetical protein